MPEYIVEIVENGHTTQNSKWVVFLRTQKDAKLLTL